MIKLGIDYRLERGEITVVDDKAVLIEFLGLQLDLHSIVVTVQASTGMFGGQGIQDVTGTKMKFLGYGEHVEFPPL